MYQKLAMNDVDRQSNSRHKTFEIVFILVSCIVSKQQPTASTSSPPIVSYFQFNFD